MENDYDVKLGSWFVRNSLGLFWSVFIILIIKLKVVDIKILWLEFYLFSLSLFLFIVGIYVFSLIVLWDLNSNSFIFYF